MNKDKEQQAFGIFEAEAFRDKSVVDMLKAYVIGSKVEQHPEASGEEDDQKTWHIYYIKLPPDKLQTTIGLIQKGMYDGWYSLLWDSRKIHVIFNSGVRSIANTSTGSTPSFDVGDVKRVVDIAKSHGLDEKYMEHYLQVGINDFKSQTIKRGFIMISRISSKLDEIASTLESKGYLKEAEELDIVSNTIEAMDKEAGKYGYGDVMMAETDYNKERFKQAVLTGVRGIQLYIRSLVEQLEDENALFMNFSVRGTQGRVTLKTVYYLEGGKSYLFSEVVGDGFGRFPKLKGLPKDANEVIELLKKLSLYANEKLNYEDIFDTRR